MLYMPGTCNARAQIYIYRYLWVEVGVAILNLALPTSSGGFVVVVAPSTG